MLAYVIVGIVLVVVLVPLVRKGMANWRAVSNMPPRSPHDYINAPSGVGPACSGANTSVGGGGGNSA